VAADQVGSACADTVLAGRRDERLRDARMRGETEVVVAAEVREKAPPVLDLAGRIFAIVWAIHSRKDGPRLSQTIVPLPLPPNGQFEIPLPIPLPFAVTSGRTRESRA
jgi:hypothetical protein